jgi:hypothetical protein
MKARGVEIENMNKTKHTSPFSLPNRVLLVLTLLLGLAAGCAHSPDAPSRDGVALSITTPQPPPFLAGPMAVLLTNAAGFSAQLTTEAEYTPNEPAIEPPHPKSGQLLCRGTRLLFAPNQKTAGKKAAALGGFLFSWDVAAGIGYVLSEPLQGYAPAVAKVQATNVVRRPSQGAPQIIQGHLCVPQEVTVETTDGLASTFQVWSAKDLSGLPLRITPAPNSSMPAVRLSNVKAELPAEDLFNPPEGFTRYASPEIMVDEIAIRRRNLKRPLHEDVEPPFRQNDQRSRQ